MIDDTTGDGLPEGNDLSQTTDQQTPGEGTTGTSADGTEGKPLYTPEEFSGIHPKDIDLERVAPEARPYVEKVVRELKEVKGAQTRTSQELAEIKRAQQAEAETAYFSDPQKNQVFANYLKSPTAIVSQINAEIARHEAVTPYDDDGLPNTEAYRIARAHVSYWQGIKDEFAARKMELTEGRQAAEIEKTRLAAELGEEREAMEEYAETLGFTKKDFREKPELRKSVKALYARDKAARTADGKGVKPKPSELSTPSGSGGKTTKPEVDEGKLWFPNSPEMHGKKRTY